MNQDEIYMWRCLQLAVLGSGNVAPNPMVGAVAVHEGRIIGEGYHERFGGPHAEVNCINNIPQEQKHLLSEATLYVSLEPCCHFGKTPPCADLIVKHKVKRVVVGCVDTTAKVNGAGINILREAGIEVVINVLEEEARELNKRFFTFHELNRPFIVLKWACSRDGFMGSADKRIKISNSLTDKMVHKWRSEESAILIGSNTAVIDNPSLTTRLWEGANPLRILLDPQLKAPKENSIMSDGNPTLVINYVHSGSKGSVTFVKADPKEDLLFSTLKILRDNNLLSVLVEGGAFTLHRFIASGLWDEARVITNESLLLGDGVPSPQLNSKERVKSEKILNDDISFFKNPSPQKI